MKPSHVLHGLYDKRVKDELRELTDRLTGFWGRKRAVVELDKGARANGNSRPGFMHKFAPRWWFDRIGVWFHDNVFQYGGVWMLCPLSGKMEWEPLSFTEANFLYLDFAVAGAVKWYHHLWAYTAWFFLQFSVYPWILWLYYRVTEED